jgi:ribosomal protein L7Ae-like RNA K-turn-binding protein
LTAPEGGRTPQRQLLDLLGLASRARKIVSGTDSVRQGVRDGEVALILLAADASPTQRAKLTPLLEARRVPGHRVFSRDQIGAAIGRGPVAAVGITDPNFTRRAKALIAAISASQDSVQEEA